MIRYTIEQLYHFSCDECGKWFSIGDCKLDNKLSNKLTCPNCGKLQNVMVNVASKQIKKYPRVR